MKNLNEFTEIMEVYQYKLDREKAYNKKHKKSLSKSLKDLSEDEENLPFSNKKWKKSK